MEARRWQQEPRSTRSSRPTGGARGGGPHKRVTVAPTCRCVTDRRYVVRTPLVSAQPQTSILKRTSPEKHVDQDNPLDVPRREHTDRNFLLGSGEELTVGSVSPSYTDVSAEDLGPPLSGRFVHEGRTSGPHLSSSRSLSSSNLEIQRLRPPLRSCLTSTALHLRCRPGRTQGGPEPRVGPEDRPSFFGGRSEREAMTPNQSSYWACAIPTASPPSPDRRAPDWDPGREYEALLDYTYPLRPGHVVSAWGGCELLEDSLLNADLQDSGIDLENLCCSADLSGSVVADPWASDPPGCRGSSAGGPASRADPDSVSVDCVDCRSHRGGGLNRYTRGGLQHRAPSSSSSSPTPTPFIRSTRVLPQARRGGGEVDEEFWPLPDQLEELQQLCRQVREVTVQLSRPVTASWESLEPGTLSEEEEEEEEEPVEGKDETGRAEIDRWTSGDNRETFGAGTQGQSGLREGEDVVGLLSEPPLPDRQGSEDQGDSLLKHIQVFSSHLERLIQQLYAVSEKTQLLSAPGVDVMDGVKPRPSDHQREASRRPPLSAGVLRSGRRLLSCMDSTSPLLRESLLLIEGHSEVVLSSVLSAVDSLTQPGPPSPVGTSGDDDNPRVLIQRVEAVGTLFP